MNKCTTKKCLFCEESLRQKLVLENDEAFVIFDEFPVNPGHCLIIPKRHVSSYFDLNSEEVLAMHQLLLKAKKLVTEQFNPDGFNIGVNVGEAGGQSVFHVHMHLIPRYKGDIENPRGGIRGVIPGKRSY